MPSHTPLDETFWEYNGLIFGGDTDYNDVACDSPLLAEARVEVVPKLMADGSWVYSQFSADLAFVLTGKYVGDPGGALAAMYETWSPAFAPRDDDLPLWFRFPGMAEAHVMARPVRRAFNLDRLAAMGYVEWAVAMQCGDPTWAAS